MNSGSGHERKASPERHLQPSSLQRTFNSTQFSFSDEATTQEATPI
jgi:hypothetical protein